MTILKTDEFQAQLWEITNFIAQDSVNQAFHFIDSLDAVLKTLPAMPYRCRKSIYFDNEQIRDLVFKGYCVPYRIESSNLIILGIIKYRENF